MARGKHAVSAAKRRMEATQDHVDRLTEQLVEAKLRARQFEAAAKRLPLVEGEVARLRKQVDEETSDKLEAERLRYQRREEGLLSERLELAQVLRERVGNSKFSSDDYSVLRRALGADGFAYFLGGDEASRTLRRNCAVSPESTRKFLNCRLAER